MLVNSEMKDNCCFCRVEQDRETLNKECVRGLWSVNKVKEPKVPHGRVSSQEFLSKA